MFKPHQHAAPTFAASADAYCVVDVDNLLNTGCGYSRLDIRKFVDAVQTHCGQHTKILAVANRMAPAVREIWHRLGAATKVVGTNADPYIVNALYDHAGASTLLLASGDADFEDEIRDFRRRGSVVSIMGRLEAISIRMIDAAHYIIPIDNLITPFPNARSGAFA